MPPTALRQPNEATRMAEMTGREHSFYDRDPDNDGEGFVRSMHSRVTLEDSALDRDDNNILGMGFAPSRDPHRIGQIYSGLIYDIFVSIYERELAAGRSPEVAVAVAQDTVGKLVIRSTRYLGEHSTSFRQVALALLAVDNGANRSELVAALTSRTLLDVDEDVDAALNERFAHVPDYVLPPSLTSADEVFAHLEAFEEKQVARAIAADDDSCTCFGTTVSSPLSSWLQPMRSRCTVTPPPAMGCEPSG